jgi:sulfide:quinone oxidoreductase
MNGKTILILGAGIGGIVAASQLRKALSHEHHVVLVERETRHVFPPSLLWLMVGLRKPEQISRPLSALSERGVDLVQGVVEGIDAENRSARVNGRDIKADYMIIALGTALAPESVPGLSQAGHNFYTLSGAESLRDARLAVRHGRLVVLVSSIPFKCPAAPYEAALLLEYDWRKRKLRDDFQIDVYTPEPGPMPIAGPPVSTQIRGMIEAKGIGFHPEHAAAAPRVTLQCTARQRRQHSDRRGRLSREEPLHPQRSALRHRAQLQRAAACPRLGKGRHDE